MSGAHIRGYEPSDLDQLYEICLRTGAAGEDATDLVVDPRLFGEIYAAPYGVLEPEHALVLDDGSGAAIGYVLGALDTRCSRRGARPSGGRRCARGIRSARAGTSSTSSSSRSSTATNPPITPWWPRYPSHLHIDLLPHAQGAGWGRRLMSALEDLLAGRRVRGRPPRDQRRNHRAIAFYRHLGYEELDADAVGYTFGRRLTR